MIPTQNIFYSQLSNTAHFPQNTLNTTFNLSLLNQLRSNLPLSPLAYTPPNMASSSLVSFSYNMALIKFQQDLQAQVSSSMYSIKQPIFENNSSPFQELKGTINKPFYEDSKSSVTKSPERPLSLPADAEICLEAQIKYMIQFFVKSFGTTPQQEFKQRKHKFSKNLKLIQVFEALESKYAKTTKTREEMTKWVIRRCLKTNKISMKKQQNKKHKQALKDLCTRYFKDEGESNTEEEETENDLVERVLPFRKNSKNKTINNQFLSEIFQSQDFKTDYREFLKDLDDITDKENSEKINRFTAFLMSCVKKGDFSPIANYKRIPWLKVWINNTEKIAHELNDGNYDGRSQTNKKVK